MRYDPVTQVRTGWPSGQCTEASIASILGCPLDDVPDLWAGPDVDQTAEVGVVRPLHRAEALRTWMRREHGVIHCTVKLLDDEPDLRVAYHRARIILPVPTASWSEYHMFGGKNQNGMGHMVVGQRGKLAWDPNPLRRGIVSAHEVSWLVPMDALPEKVRLRTAPVWKESERPEIRWRVGATYTLAKSFPWGCP